MSHPIHFVGTFALLGATLFAAQPLELINPVGGEHRILFVQRAGTPVAQGETVVLLDPTPHTNSLANAKSDWDSARAAAQKSADNATAWENESTNRKSQLEREADTAANALSHYQDIELPTECRNAEQAVVDAGFALDTQKERFAQRDNLLAQGIIRKLEWTGEEVTLKRLQAAYDNAVTHRKAVVEIDTVAQLAKLQTEANTKKSALDDFVKNIPVEAAKRKKDAETAKAHVDTCEKKLKLLEALVKSAMITAPQAGVFSPNDGINVSGTVAGGETLGWIAPGKKE